MMSVRVPVVATTRTAAKTTRKSLVTVCCFLLLQQQQSLIHTTFAFVPTSSRRRQGGAFRVQAKRNQHDEIIIAWSNNGQLLLKQACKGLAVSIVMLGALLLIHPDDSNSRQHQFSAFAQDTAPTVLVETSKEPSLLGSTMMSNSPSVVDEVWTLVNKYYIDRTFHGQDWDRIHDKYAALEKSSSSNGQSSSLDLVTEMVKTLGDKYSRVLDPSQYTSIQKYDLIGVGATLMPNEQKEIIVGAPPIAGSASDQAGLKAGDFIEAINGISTEGRTAFDIIDQISEQPNAKTVAMTVRSKDGTVTQEMIMERQFLKVRNPVSYQITERRKDGTVVGFIRIAEFNSLVKARLEDAIASLEKEGANAFVLDLRGNPGGAFQSAVEISSLFVEDRVATYVVDSNQVQLPFRTAGGRVILPEGNPMAIWVDGGSASASEVLTGSLHDNCRAVVMGEKSFGKGLIQAVYGLKNGAGLVLTVAKYVTPNGTEIQGIGITPDIKGGVPFQPIIGLLPDTSQVDFGDISKRLSPAMCKVPFQHPEMKSMN